MILLGISRYLFTHSLPLIAAEQCYIQLIKDTSRILKARMNLQLSYAMEKKISEPITIFLYFMLLKINQKIEAYEKRRAIKFDL